MKSIIDIDMVCDFIGSMTEEQITSLAEQLTEQHEGRAQFLLEQIQRVRQDRNFAAYMEENYETH